MALVLYNREIPTIPQRKVMIMKRRMFPLDVARKGGVVGFRVEDMADCQNNTKMYLFLCI